MDKSVEIIFFGVLDVFSSSWSLFSIQNEYLVQNGQEYFCSSAHITHEVSSLKNYETNFLISRTMTARGGGARFHIEQLQTGKSEKAQPSPRFRGACWGLSPPAREGRPRGCCLRPGPGCHGTRSRCPRAALRTARQIRVGATQEHLPAAPPRPALP